MMDYYQYLLAKLAEEATEVAQIALKTQQFGAEEMMHGQPFTNVQRIHQELNDLLAVVDVLNDTCHFGFLSDEEQIAAKKVKMDRYLRHSINLGRVDAI